jgi:hypothetical protein
MAKYNKQLSDTWAEVTAIGFGSAMICMLLGVGYAPLIAVGVGSLVLGKAFDKMSEV